MSSSKLLGISIYPSSPVSFANSNDLSMLAITACFSSKYEIWYLEFKWPSPLKKNCNWIFVAPLFLEAPVFPPLPGHVIPAPGFLSLTTSCAPNLIGIT